MRVLSRRSRIPLGLALTLACAAAPVSAGGKDALLVSEQEVAISSYAAAAGARIEAARAGVRAGDAGLAEGEIAQAESLLRSMRESHPFGAMRRFSRQARQRLDAGELAQADAELRRLSEALDKTGPSVSREAAQRHLEDARRALKGKDPSGARREMEFLERELVVDEIDLPLSSVEGHFRAARRALAGKDLKAAGRALGSAEEGLEYLTATGRRPLAQARKNLLRAVVSNALGRLDLAQSSLDKASAWLLQAARSPEGRSKEEREQLAGEVAGLAREVSEGRRGSQSGIEPVWRICAALAEKEVELLSSGWQYYLHHRDVYEALSNAKFNLVQAERKDVLEGSRETAMIQLQSARHELRRAIRHAPSDMKGELEAILKDVESLEKAPPESKDALKEKYFKAIYAIQELIRDRLLQPYGWNVP